LRLGAAADATRQRAVASPPRVGRWLWALVSIVLVVGSGCTSFREYVQNGFKVGPNYLRPAAPVAEDWINGDDQRVRKVEDDLAQWWKVLNDPALDTLVADAYRQNLTLRDAGFRVLQARAMLGIAIGEFFPQSQYVSGDYLRQALSTKSANRGFLTKRFFNQWDLGFGLAWEVDFWGRFRRGIEAADADMNASVENYDDVLVTLLGDVAQYYTEIRIYERQIQLTLANVELQKETLRLVTARFQGGQVSELDVDQAQSLLSQTESQVPALEINQRIANNQLCVLLGRPMVDLEPAIGPADIPTAPTDLAVGIPADLLRRRPDVRRAERLAAGQAARIGVAISDYYPHISILGTADWQAQDFQHMFTGRALQGEVGPGFQWNILQYGRILNNVRQTDALFQQLVVDYQQAVLVAQQETENGLITFLKSHEQAKDLVESVFAANKAVVIALAQYKAGMIDFNRVSLLEQNLVTQQNLLAQARGAIALGLIQTYRAIGGGWTSRLNPTLENTPGMAQKPPLAPGEPEPIVTPGAVPAMDPLVPQGVVPEEVPPGAVQPAAPPGNAAPAAAIPKAATLRFAPPTAPGQLSTRVEPISVALPPAGGPAPGSGPAPPNNTAPPNNIAPPNNTAPPAASGSSANLPAPQAAPATAPLAPVGGLPAAPVGSQSPAAWLLPLGTNRAAALDTSVPPARSSTWRAPSQSRPTGRRLSGDRARGWA
jgi:NodT family efflux transporter outer membrane factor (OMF) lipoprotein